MERYSVKLPWKPDVELVPNHYGLCHQRMKKKNKDLLNKYNTIIKEQSEECKDSLFTPPCSNKGRQDHNKDSYCL